MKDITSDALGETSKHLLQTLVKFLNGIVLCSNIPDAVQSSFFGASLIALSKKDGGVRPIAVGNTLRRLAGKACVFIVSRNQQMNSGYIKWVFVFHQGLKLQYMHDETSSDLRIQTAFFLRLILKMLSTL